MWATSSSSVALTRGISKSSVYSESSSSKKTTHERKVVDIGGVELSFLHDQAWPHRLVGPNPTLVSPAAK
jgi:hypothetical protein